MLGRLSMLASVGLALLLGWQLLSASQAPDRAQSIPALPAHWTIEAESQMAQVTFTGEGIDIDTPAGLTLWLNQELAIPTRISFEAMAVSQGGANDHVSDLNAFWMARNADGSSVLSQSRSGAFADYDTLLTYYVGIGGNRNTTTRMRRYVGVAGVRPILPQHDRGDAAALLAPNQWTKITLIAQENRFAVERDGEELFEYLLAEPYRSGHFALRTTTSHLKFRNVRIGESHAE